MLKHREDSEKCISLNTPLLQQCIAGDVTVANFIYVPFKYALGLRLGEG